MRSSARVMDEIFHAKTTADQVRVWVAGCATGEEAYSVAIMLLEYAERLPVSALDSNLRH